MKIHELKPARGSRRKRTRLGRGIGSGKGKTCGRGQKGQKSRSGSSLGRGFEGGQMPLYRRVPKRGFTNVFKKDIVTLNVGDLNSFKDGTEVTPELLIASGKINKLKDGVKILGGGKLEKRLTVKMHRFSKAAAEKIQEAGGKAEVV